MSLHWREAFEEWRRRAAPYENTLEDAFRAAYEAAEAAEHAAYDAGYRTGADAGYREGRAAAVAGTEPPK